LIDAMRTAARALPLPEAVATAVEMSGMAAHFKAEKDGQDRIQNLEELVHAAESFVRESELKADRLPLQAPADGFDVDAADPLVAFLAHAALEAGDTQAAEGRPALQLMSVHAAKGLEFHTVFVTGLEEGLFPHENSLDTDGGLDEERRLMYVAITRARRRLYLTYAQSRMLHGQMRYNIQSRFIDEIPAELLQWLSPQRMRARALDVDTAEWGQLAPPTPGAPRATPPAQPWRIGQNVRHAKFGVGVIVDAEGRGNDARVQVNFRDAGVKWLALEYAKLEAA
jgi:DNA helicase-2/ATP-dependent DNA helicase PcrA